jgi:hypothetical protein
MFALVAVLLLRFGTAHVTFIRHANDDTIMERNAPVANGYLRKDKKYED